MSGQVPPSSRAGQRRRIRAPKAIGKAVSIFERFTGHEADLIQTVQVRALPKVAAAIGYVTAICYVTERDGKVEDYMHEFAEVDQPIFAVSPDGKQLLMIGGHYDFTERGIVDRSDKSR